MEFEGVYQKAYERAFQKAYEETYQKAVQDERNRTVKCLIGHLDQEAIIKVTGVTKEQFEDLKREKEKEINEHIEKLKRENFTGEMLDE